MSAAAHSPIASASYFAAQYAFPPKEGPPADRRGRLLFVEPPRHPAQDGRVTTVIDVGGRSFGLWQGQEEGLPGLADRIAVPGGSHSAVLTAVDEQLDAVFPRHLQRVLNDNPSCRLV